MVPLLTRSDSAGRIVPLNRLPGNPRTTTSTGPISMVSPIRPGICGISRRLTASPARGTRLASSETDEPWANDGCSACSLDGPRDITWRTGPAVHRASPGPGCCPPEPRLPVDRGGQPQPQPQPSGRVVEVDPELVAQGGEPIADGSGGRAGPPPSRARCAGCRGRPARWRPTPTRSPHRGREFLLRCRCRPRPDRRGRPPRASGRVVRARRRRQRCAAGCRPVGGWTAGRARYPVRRRHPDGIARCGSSSPWVGRFPPRRRRPGQRGARRTV